MRYRDKRGVAEVLRWLAALGVSVHRDTYQSFMRRVLWVLPDDVAKALQVDLGLLRAVRCRLRAPLCPAAGRKSAPKATRPFHSRSRQRRVGGEKKPKPAKEPPSDPVRRGGSEPGLLPRAVAMSSFEPISAMTGTPEAPLSLPDWRILNDIARQKVFAKDRRMHTNHHGRVTHLSTGRDYTPEQLVAEFGLTPDEAQSCYEDFPG